MEHAAIAANAQRDLEAETPPGAPDWQEVETDDEGQEDDDELEEQGEQPAEQPEPAPAAVAPEAQTTEPPKFSRRDAARFAADLEVRTRERDEARTIMQTAQRELEQVNASQRHILTQLGKVSGYERDSSGKFVYEQLAERVLNGTATAEERQTAVEMRQWHELAGPIYREAEKQVQRQYGVNWQGLGELEGIGTEHMAQLNTAPDAISAIRAVHAMALAAGEARASAQAQQTIARLQAENKSLKRNQLVRSPQPAGPNGPAVPSGRGWQDLAFDSSGQIKPEFEREVAQGKWLGRDLSSS